MLNASGGPDGSEAASAGHSGPVSADGLRERVRDFVAGHDPATMSRLDFLRARFDAGLAAVHYPAGLGGLGLPRALQAVVEAEFAAAGAPGNQPERIGIGLGMAAPTILAFGTEEQKARWIRPLWTGEEVWCQLFSEPGAGSDLAGLATRAVREDGPPAADAAGNGSAPGADGGAGGSPLGGERPEGVDVHGPSGPLGPAAGPDRPGRAQARRADLLRLRHDRRWG